MKENFQWAVHAVLQSEGGFTKNPKDPGGATNLGVTLENFRRYVKADGTEADLKKLTKAQASAVYKAQYWDAVGGDELPSGLDYAVFDFAVNSGPKRAAEFLQGILRVVADGSVGPKTIAAANAADVKQVISDLQKARLLYLKRLDTWPYFRRGWTTRVEAVRTKALSVA